MDEFKLFEDYYKSTQAQNDFKLFIDYKSEENKGLYYLTEQENAQIDEYVKIFENEYANDLSKLDEAFFGKVLGGVAGFLVGPTIGKIIANALGIEKGILFDMFTSRLVSTALGSAIAKNMGKK
jgi:hypothetical protein